MRHHRGMVSALVAGAFVLGTLGTAQAFPDKAVTYIIPFGPGGESDIAARHQQPFFKKLTGQNLIISYKPGGGGAVGWSQLNGMKGDGYTVMGINLPHIIIKPMQKKVGFTTADITAIHMFQYTPDAIVVEKNSPFKSVKDLIAYAKKNPKKVTFSGSGKGTANHIAQVRFDKMAGIKTTYIPFKGTGASVQALLGKQVKAQWGYTTVGAKHAGKVRLLAVAMEKRHPIFAKVPTFKELGFDLVSGAYRGVAVPKSTPEKQRKALAALMVKINKDPGFVKKMHDDGFALVNITYGKKMDAFIAEKAKVYGAAAKQAGVVK